ncbi:DUF1254 domain-containing protein [Metapseudomonas lalkuanensis]|uniref:DUF1254 domain-containing protein n=1 Tax=Metapseudomonas lalkuanensis TaxID=2604832 RepID=A0A5J6QKJ9_9GAMM|nr:DUF1254 domain-containing protein [Pseudomonas lalkuanensis]QEY62897.1 DUF1254 domain-containing protein [Pseudomonas lalkuanensis]
MALTRKLRWRLGLGATALAAGLTVSALQVVEQGRETAQAYLFAYPLVLMELTRQHQALLGTTAINGFRHSRRFPDASFNSVVSPNVDTLYSIAHFDLRQEPVVMSIPPTGERYYMMPIMDAWTNVVASPGTRTIGSGGGIFLVAGPSWKGQLPEGMQLLRIPTEMAWMIGRIRSAGPRDYAEVHTLQDQFQLMPLSVWQGAPRTSAPAGMVELPPLDPARGPDKQLAGWSREDFFGSFCRLLRDNPPRAEDETMLRRIAAAGLLDADCSLEQSPLQRLGSFFGYRKVVAELEDSQRLLGKRPTFNGWRIGYELGEYGTRYQQRALVAKLGLGANSPEDAIYPNLHQDPQGQTLRGDKRYLLHFAKDQLPPARAFWSLTLYNDRQLLSANPLDRYALGDRDPLRYNADGSLDLLVQRQPPDDEQLRANWLPAPDGRFNLFLRLYWPQPEALQRQWLPPQIRLVQ